MFNSKHVKKELVASCDFQHYSFTDDHVSYCTKDYLREINSFPRRLLFFRGTRDFKCIYLCLWIIEKRDSKCSVKLERQKGKKGRRSNDHTCNVILPVDGGASSTELLPGDAWEEDAGDTHFLRVL